jgi:hypothetical protein
LEILEGCIKLKINPSVLEQTTKCSFDFLCLEDEAYPLCQAHHPINGVTEVLEHRGENCPYAVIFGANTFCTCPTRSEILKEYHL